MLLFLGHNLLLKTAEMFFVGAVSFVSNETIYFSFHIGHVTQKLSIVVRL